MSDRANQSERLGQIARACEALRAGRIADCESIAIPALESMRDRPPCPSEAALLARELERLRALAQSAQGGIEAASALLRELAATAGGLDHYTPGGRGRIDTRIGRQARRF